MWGGDLLGGGGFWGDLLIPAEIELALASTTSGCSCHAMDHHFLIIWWSESTNNDCWLVGERTWHWQAKLGRELALSCSTTFLPEKAKIKNLKKIFIKFVRTKGSRQVQVKSRVQLQTEESRARQTQKIQDSEVELCKTEWYHLREKICRARSFSGCVWTVMHWLGEKFGQKSWQGKIEPVSGEEKLRIKPRDI